MKMITDIKGNQIKTLRAGALDQQLALMTFIILRSYIIWLI